MVLKVGLKVLTSGFSFLICSNRNSYVLRRASACCFGDKMKKEMKLVGYMKRAFDLDGFEGCKEVSYSGGE